MISIAEKQATSIYKEGIEFRNDPISTGNTIVYLPKQHNKYNDLIKNYELKKEHRKLMTQQNRQR